MFLGPINVRASRKEVQLKVKDEYNNYRKLSALHGALMTNLDMSVMCHFNFNKNLLC
ncbi:hypothetical protein ES288_D06G146500v1 [Gossypium darwinii]|uniref:Uncharacterized protein n=2 Tax=Gossypium TaxID=3633 RepID=A0A5D2KI40_GOSTO|nr:hypothetical protein ES288_D06G146500v1 [Gossypium darwinii]TYH66831.1 hypothetical protein ES332_D06G149200v1 [Gossypium tomentosum]